ncbi:hypothetical protein AB0F72_28660 [Actinoplanes sp. NPDC023936]|uniref:hypothetical protein n=1 Tax=Actinoplanes sp. NPDC023936 TaxID=3154910 RepID=UPI0033E8B890
MWRCHRIRLEAVPAANARSNSPTTTASKCGAPSVTVLAGIVTGLYTDAIADTLNSTVAQHVAEVILTVLLFVESGYNDGIMSPIFSVALILAGTSSTADTPIPAATRVAAAFTELAAAV